MAANQVQGLIRGYLPQGTIMQVASVAAGQPWICTVYYVSDDACNLYWLSLPSRRHSRELASHPKAAAAVAIKYYRKPVIGLQVEGDVEEVTDASLIARIMKRYVAKYNAGKYFYDNFVAGKNQHRLYRLKPRLIVLFDEVHFDRSNSRHEWLSSSLPG